MGTSVVDLMPEWMRSARLRIALLYSVIMFALGALLLATLYFALLSSLDEGSLSQEYFQRGGGRGVGDIILTDLQTFEQQVNAHALTNLRRFSFGALIVLFVVSLGVGWVVAGRALSPIGRIAEVANRIQATDLSQRIALQGPSDELKRLADTFDSMLTRLDQAFSAQRQFIADASHELRNPVAIIRTNLDVVLSDENASETDLRHTAVVVKRAAERIGRLVDDLLALARLETPDAMREDIDLASMVREVIEEFRAVAAERAIHLYESTDSGLEVEGDRETLKRAVGNLVDNAVKLAPRGSRVTIGDGQKDGWIWVAVEDQGPGMQVSDQRRAFDRFWRSEEVRARGQAGSGLGLAIVRQVAESHSGTVRLFSDAGRGSTFVIWLPEDGLPRPAGPPEIRPELG